MTKKETFPVTKMTVKTMAQMRSSTAAARVVRRLTEVKRRTFPTKTFPERCYGSDVWYPKCDVLVPHVLPSIPYSSTTSYLPSH